MCRVYMMTVEYVWWCWRTDMLSCRGSACVTLPGTATVASFLRSDDSKGILDNLRVSDGICLHLFYLPSHTYSSWLPIPQPLQPPAALTQSRISQTEPSNLKSTKRTMQQHQALRTRSNQKHSKPRKTRSKKALALVENLPDLQR